MATNANPKPGLCVYLITSLSNPEARYVGLTTDLRQRLADHNAGRSPHTRACRPWRLDVAVWFRNPDKARDFERYLKEGSGHAFARRHLW